MSEPLDQPHSHTWERTETRPLGSELMQIEERCACGDTRTRVGYTWARRRRPPRSM